MITKVLSYQSKSLKKAVYLCEAILDPRAKTKEIKKNTLTAASLADREALIEFFSNEAHNFVFSTVIDPEVEIIYPPSSDEDEDDDRPRHYKSKRTPISVKKEIRQYLSIPEEDKSCVPLDSWRTQRTNWPVLLRMARCMLPVPASSAPSKRCFSSAGESC